jgi:hypothetical protein
MFSKIMKKTDQETTYERKDLESDVAKTASLILSNIPDVVN